METFFTDLQQLCIFFLITENVRKNRKRDTSFILEINKKRNSKSETLVEIQIVWIAVSLRSKVGEMVKTKLLKKKCHLVDKNHCIHSSSQGEPRRNENSHDVTDSSRSEKIQSATAARLESQPRNQSDSPYSVKASVGHCA